ncbi:histone deacetylase family protein [Granulosicoccus antarcticus]|uniref:Acetylpolyamine aminohydrolase n=1 Tax=Granulosicoccus antarcticus IMCC3135 TaxID=1192854 RepID=A0A2Z2NSJ9_9GAMM|nr:histone deacetylase family protein [Granulosicoccus antarcticus]ASJ70557.1 Acetylpolyamine aminohydrolase [Granulosicoccus antarcticus IMCC3135]
MKTIASTDHVLHFPKAELSGGELVRPYECPERWDYIVEALANSGFSAPQAPTPLDMATVEKVHGDDYLRFLAQAWSLWEAEGYQGEALPMAVPNRRMQQREPENINGKLGYFAGATETAITATTWQAVQSSAACAQTAARLLGTSETSAFALCRPPGHHAGFDLYGGYCFLNNAAIAAQQLRDAGASKVAILDVDFHHGNGTQDIFYERNDVLFVSLHGNPGHAFPYFLGYADETGKNEGEGYNINYPMLPGTRYSVWSDALTDALDRIDQYFPDALVVSLGVDTFERDPISFFKLTSDDFTRYGNAIGKRKHPTLFVMEGGYAVEEIGINTRNVLQGFLNA